MQPGNRWIRRCAWHAAVWALAVLLLPVAARAADMSKTLRTTFQVAETGFDPEYGARPLRRLIQKVIVDKLADRMIRGELKDGGKVKISLKNAEVTVSV